MRFNERRLGSRLGFHLRGKVRQWLRMRCRRDARDLFDQLRSRSDVLRQRTLEFGGLFEPVVEFGVGFERSGL